MRTQAAAVVVSVLLVALGGQQQALAEGPSAATRSTGSSTGSSIFAPRPTAPPSPPAAVATPGDEGLGLGQFALAAAGTVVTLGVGLSLTLLTDDQEDRAFGTSFLVAPIVAGLVVCQVGRRSVLYTGRCPAAVAGAYVGAVAGTLSGLLLGYAVCSGSSTSSSSSPDSGSSGGWDCAAPIVIAGSIGYLVGTATGALVGWNISKQRGHLAAPGATGSAAPNRSDGSDGEEVLVVSDRDPRSPRLRSDVFSPRQVIFPLFATAF